MKKLILIALLMLSSSIAAQKKSQLQPTIGIHWTGGIQYAMDHESPSLQAGFIFTPKKSELSITDLKLSAEYYFDVIPEKLNSRDDSYQFRLQASKEFIQYWSVSVSGGYINSISGNIMEKYSGQFKNNLSYGIGIQTSDDMIVGELMFEMLAGYPHLSVGVNYKFKSLINKQK